MSSVLTLHTCHLLAVFCHQMSQQAVIIFGLIKNRSLYTFTCNNELGVKAATNKATPLKFSIHMPPVSLTGNKM